MRVLAKFAMIAWFVIPGASFFAPTADADRPSIKSPYLVVLGVAQDGGLPQTANHDDPAWIDSSLRRQAVCLGLVDPQSQQKWMFEATPDFRMQLRQLDLLPPRVSPLPSGIFLTHAHMGHYTGLMFLGHESVGARNVGVFAMPQMRTFLEQNGPWSQLVKYKNIKLQSLHDSKTVTLNERLRVTPFIVPHRQEFSEVVGYRIDGPKCSVLFVPDIDSWEELDDMGTSIERFIATVDVAYLDATFYGNGEIPGRDMNGFPHPFIQHSMKRFAKLPASDRAKIHFIHFNHTNPVARPASEEEQTVLQAGFRITQQGDRIQL